MRTMVAALFGIWCSAAAANDTVNFSKSGSIGSIVIDAKETASAKKTDRNWQTSYGSYDRDFFRTKTIAVDITRFGDIAKSTPGLSTEVLWFAQKLAGKDPFIYSWQKSELKFQGGQRLLRSAFTMPALESNVTNYEALGEKWVSGSKILGWIVYVRDTSTGEVLRHRASSQTVENLAKGDLASMLAAYTSELKLR